MTEKIKFLILLVLLIASVGLLVFMNSTYGHVLAP